MPKSRLAALEGSRGLSEEENEKSMQRVLEQMQESGENYPAGMHGRKDLEWTKNSKGKWSYRYRGKGGSWTPWGGQ